MSGDISEQIGLLAVTAKRSGSMVAVRVLRGAMTVDGDALTLVLALASSPDQQPLVQWW